MGPVGCGSHTLPATAALLLAKMLAALITAQARQAAGRPEPAGAWAGAGAGAGAGAEDGRDVTLQPEVKTKHCAPA